MLASIEEFPRDRIWEIDSSTEADQPAESSSNRAETVRSTSKFEGYTREEFIAALALFTPLPKAIASEEVTTCPLYDVFANLYPPKIHPRRSSMQMIQSLVANSASNPASAKATKAVALSILSRANRTTHFSHAAAQMYSEALWITRRQLTELSADRIVLIGTAHMLALCELFFSVALDDRGARPHTRWVISLIESYCMSPDTPRTHPLLTSPMRLFATWESLIARQIPSDIRVPVEDMLEPVPGSMATLSNLSIWTASLIERNDELCQKETYPSLAKVLSVLEELVRIEGKIHAWMASYYESTTGSLYHFASAPARRKKGLLLIFTLAYDFSDLESAMLHIGYWMCLLALVEAQADILKVYNDIIGVESALRLVQLDRLSIEYADNICMSINFMGKPDCGWSGTVIAIRPLRFLLLHYKKRREWQKLKWCIDCAAEFGI